MGNERIIPEPKFRVSDKVLVCNELKTEISSVEYENGEWRYYFKDENNNTKCENEYAIEFIKESMFNPFQPNINAINETIDYINFNVESEAVRLISSHYKLQTGNWNWIYRNQVDKKSWEMAKQHASNTAEENVKQSVINKLDNKIIDFWFDVIRRIEKL